MSDRTPILCESAVVELIKLLAEAAANEDTPLEDKNVGADNPLPNSPEE